MTKKERLEDLGRLRERLEVLMDLDIFDNTSKHDPYWGEVNPKDLESKYGTLTVEAVLGDRLDSCRMQFSMIHDLISECWNVARGEDEE